MLDAATLRIAGSLPAGARAIAPGEPRPALPDAARAALDRSRLLLLQRTVAATDEAVALAHGVVDEAAVRGRRVGDARGRALQPVRVPRHGPRADRRPPRRRRRNARSRSTPSNRSRCARCAIILGKSAATSARRKTSSGARSRRCRTTRPCALNYAELLTVRRPCGRSARATRARAPPRSALGVGLPGARDVPAPDAPLRRGRCRLGARPRGRRQQPVAARRRNLDRARGRAPRRRAGEDHRSSRRRCRRRAAR